MVTVFACYARFLHYHQKYAGQSNKEIRKRADAKEQELAAIFSEVAQNTTSDPVRIAVLGCGDKRLIAHHKRFFEHVLERSVEVTTLDITIEHLKGEAGVVQHDCTKPLPNVPYDITYGHVPLKFIETEKQFDALKVGGIASSCRKSLRVRIKTLVPTPRLFPNR